MINKFTLSALALAVALPLSAGQGSISYLDSNLDPATKSEALYQHSPFNENEQGVVVINIYYKGSDQIYLATQGFRDESGALIYNGSFEYFTPEGSVLEKGQFKNNQRDGLIIKSGDYQGVEYHTTYANGLIVDKQEFYNGELARRETYEYDPNNSKNYVWRCYLGEETTCVNRFVNGLQEGLQESYDERTKRRQELHYLAGKMHGLQKVFVEGVLLVTENYQHGERHGISKSYQEDGTVVAERNYRHDVQFGETIIYFADGGIKKKVMYGEEGEPISHDSYNQDGTLRETMRSDEKLNQTLTRFGNNGEVVLVKHQPRLDSDWSEKLTFGEGGYLYERYRAVKSTEQRHVKVYHRNGVVKREYTIAANRDKHDRQWDSDGILTSELFEPGDRAQWVKSYSYYDNGAIERESLDLREGRVAIRHRYNKEGVLIAREERVGFDKQGEQITLSASGNYIDFTHYQNNQPHGSYKRRSFDGEFLAAGQYIEGNKSGVWQQIGFEDLPIPDVFHSRTSYPIAEHGQGSRLISEYRDGQLHGKYRFSDHTGEVLIDGLLQQGKPVGDWLIKRSANGEVLMKNHYENGQPNGDWVDTDFRHSVTMKGRYQQGLRVGEWKARDEQGRVLIQGEFKNGLAEGEWKTFSSDERLLCSMNYQKGQPEGEWKHYNHKGEVTWERTLSPGEISIETNHENSIGYRWNRENQVGIPSDCYINIENYFTVEYK
ncbi:toxin-antitoxin system YwqK family antitoxin [Vibrio sp. LaRot3]|uniref:toxin-antitoxin system YwqK family antitoxin n=1 Tax=Vibrio sp. LaRot3 TaxID=2998829 RepID=UPI0022CDEDCD|nr:hypothetical protein [Vibrio sp. LaRot3]MDA0148499.1 hypothetical protein [Vibrio sp. LaRot3]